MKLPSSDERAEIYKETIARISALIKHEDDWIARMATTCCELHHSFSYFHWTGFYRLIGKDTLVIGPYQGKHGCLRIPIGKGVCGTVAETGQSKLVEDVNAIANHIACSSTTQSEIVVPIFNAQQQVIAVLDIDSDYKAAFNETDTLYLEQIAKLLSLSRLTR